MLKFLLGLTFVMAMLVFSQHQGFAEPRSMLAPLQVNGIISDLKPPHHMMSENKKITHHAEHNCKDMQKKCCQGELLSNCFSHCATSGSTCLLFTMDYTQPVFETNSKVLHHSWASTPATLSSKNPPPVFHS